MQMVERLKYLQMTNGSPQRPFLKAYLKAFSRLQGYRLAILLLHQYEIFLVERLLK